ncbi:MAG: alpha/beta fold hydrolase [Myxococcota bacterium]
MELLHTAHVPAGEGPFPTVIALHGWGASAHDLFGLAPLFQGGEALTLCPQGSVSVPIAPGYEGYGWFPITGGGPPDPTEFERAASRLRSFLDEALERYPVDRRKLVLLGFSQGGVMAYELALRDPSRYVGLAALSSWLPEELVPAKLPEHEGFPTLVVHGTEDPMIPVERGRESRDRLRDLGVGLSYREFEMGHEVHPDALREVLTWLDQKALQPIQLIV